MQILGILHVYFEKKCLILHEETTNYLSKNMRIRMTLFGLLLTMVVQAQRSKTNFDFDWKFSLNQDAPANAEKKFDDRQWQDVQLPHDWCISQEFDSKLSGSIAHLHGGIGWYRKTFVVNKKEEGKKISVLFDGIYNRSDVYINGHHLGFRPYGFCYLEYDLTPYIIYGGENVIAVRANNLDGKDQHARWYTGGGIYRHAWILTSNPLHVQTYGTYITTPQVSVERSTVSIRTTVENESLADKRVSVVQIIKDEKGKALAKIKKQTLNVSK
jgi:beta-galactosidase